MHLFIMSEQLKKFTLKRKICKRTDFKIKLDLMLTLCIEEVEGNSPKHLMYQLFFNTSPKSVFKIVQANKWSN